MTFGVELGAIDVTSPDGKPVVIWWVLASTGRVLSFGVLEADDLQEVDDGSTVGPPPRPPDR